MGSAFAIGFAGPSVLLSYAIGALITLLLMGCLAEMTVAHATRLVRRLRRALRRPAGRVPGALRLLGGHRPGGGHRGHGGGHVHKYWFAGIPEWVWIISFSTLLIGLNASSVKAFGNFEYCFSTLKIAAIVAFILLGATWCSAPPTRPTACTTTAPTAASSRTA